MPEERYAFVNHRIYDYATRYSNIELVILSMLSISLPILIGHPQLVIGSIVNMLLFRVALSMQIKRALPIILLPSIGAYMGNVLFGEATPFLLYFIPVIWVSNALYVLIGKLVVHRLKKDYGASVLVASAFKSIFLFSAAYIAVIFFGFPALFLTAMGVFQFITAMIGGYTAYLGTKLENRLLASGR